MKRIYEEVVKHHLKKYSQMLFLMGPRQVGKTTTSIETGEEIDHLHYFNWDDDEDRKKILEGAQSLARGIGLEKKGKKSPLLVFDEIHKHSHWKTFLKGFYDRFGRWARILVTGSARMDIYRKGGDSLMGRYFLFRMHPLSVGEILDPSLREKELRAKPQRIDSDSWEHLLQFGGFPEPFLQAEERFYHLWRKIRNQQLFREDLRDLTRIQEIDQVERLAELLRHRTGSLVSYSSLARDIRASADTVRRWIETLSSFYYCFQVRPWSKNVNRSLRKEPKYYLWDWSLVENPGARFENFIASHLHKAVHFWSDLGLGDYQLHFVRDKEKREVDFLVTKNNKPWFLVEAKLSGKGPLSSALIYFHEKLETEHAFQVAYDKEYVEADAFAFTHPVLVSARGWLSQLV